MAVSVLCRLPFGSLVLDVVDVLHVAHACCMRLVLSAISILGVVSHQDWMLLSL